MEQAKTDARDAAMLAEYAEWMAPRLWTPPDQELLALRDVGRQINRLVHARTQAKNRLHALNAKQGTLSLLSEDEQEGIEQLERRVERLRGAAMRLIRESESLSRKFDLIIPAKGIGETSAIAILAELAVLPPDMKAKHDPCAKAFRDHLVGQGKKPIQATGALMRKYLTGIWAALQSDTPFDTQLAVQQRIASKELT